MRANKGQRAGSPAPSLWLISLLFWQLQTMDKEVAFLATGDAEPLVEAMIALSWG